MSGLETLDWYTDPSLVPDPFPYYEACRAQGPVFREPHHGVFVVTGYEEICKVYREVELFSSANSSSGPFPPLPGAPYGDDVSELIDQFRRQYSSPDSLVSEDPPLHTDHRGLLMRLMTPKRLAENEEFMWRLADQRIDTFVDRGACDFVGEYARPFSMLVIADLLGVPEEDHPKLRALFEQAGAPGKVGQELPANPIWFLDDFFLEYVLDRRADPCDDVLTKLATNTFADGRVPEPMEAVNVATILFAGGQGTVARFMGNMVHHLAEHPDTQVQLRDDRSLIPDFIEEMLRYDSPVKLNQRLARRTTTLGGVTIPAGSTILLLLPAGDRDPRHFPCPADFDPHRGNAREHIAFGRGIHSCPGAPLVRADAKVTLERILDRIADIRISDTHHGPPDARRFQYTNTYILRGVDALHIEFTPRR
jgi:cytochrome P450